MKISSITRAVTLTPQSAEPSPLDKEEVCMARFDSNGPCDCAAHQTLRAIPSSLNDVLITGAASGNRTRIFSLEGWGNSHYTMTAWCQLPDSNWRPTDYESVALPPELNWLSGPYREAQVCGGVGKNHTLWLI